MQYVKLLFRTWIGNPLLDIPAVVGIFFLTFYGQGFVLKAITGEQAFSITAATVCAAAMGFSITALTVLLSVTPGKRLRDVMASVGNRLVRLVMFTVATLVVLAGLFCFCTLGHDESREKLVVLMCSGTLAILVQLRLVAIFAQIFTLLVIEHHD